jgi:hypothetical protein
MSVGGTTPLVLRRMVLCYGVSSTHIPECPVYLFGLVWEIERPPNAPVSFVADGLWLYFEAMGAPGEYELRIEVDRLGDGGQSIGPVSVYSYTIHLGEGAWFAGRGGKLPNVPLSGSGVHEVRLRYGADVLARDQFLVEG